MHWLRLFVTFSYLTDSLVLLIEVSIQKLLPLMQQKCFVLSRAAQKNFRSKWSSNSWSLICLLAAHSHMIPIFAEGEWKAHGAQHPVTEDSQCSSLQAASACSQQGSALSDRLPSRFIPLKVLLMLNRCNCRNKCHNQSIAHRLWHLQPAVIEPLM